MATTTGSNQTQYSTADIQRNLGGLAVDNQYGAQTTAAVKAFQTANGLTADGIFGPKTLAAFQAKYGTNSGTPTVTPQTNAGTLGTNAYQVPPAPTHGSLATELGTQIPGLQNDVNTISDNQNQGVNDVQKLQDMLVGQTADTQQAEQQVGLPQLNTDLRDLQNLSKSQTAKYIQGIQNLEVKGGAAINVNAKEAFLNRQNAIDSMLTNSLISAKSGDIQTAQSQVDRAISLKYDPIKQQIQNKLDFLKLNADNLSRADKKLADAKSTQLQLQLKQIDEQQQKEKDIQSIVQAAAQNGAPNSILALMSKETTTEGVIKLAAPFMASANNDIVRLDNGNTVLVNKLTGKVIKNLGGAKASDVIPKTIVRTVAGKPVDGYALQKGDDPYFIAQQYGVTMQELQAINPNISDWNNLQVGATINVPKSDSDAFVQTLLNTKGGSKLTDTSIQKLDKGLTVLNQLGVLQANVQGVKTGPIAGLFKGANPWDTQGQTIKAQLNAIIPNLARGVYGEVGVLTDNDIKQYSKTIPNLKSTEEVRNAVLYITLDMIGKSVKNTLNVNAAAGRDVSGFTDIYTEMESAKNSILSSIPSAQIPQAFQSQNQDPFLSQFSTANISNSDFFNQFQ